MWEKTFSKKSSFTLIELIIATGISTLIMGASMSLFFSSKLSLFSNNISIKAEENVQKAMRKISKDIRLSKSTSTIISDSIGTTTSANSGSVISFQIPVGSYDEYLDIDSLGDIKWGSEKTASHYVAYYVNEKSRLVRVTYNPDMSTISNEEIIAIDIYSLRFEQASVASNLIEVKIGSLLQESQDERELLTSLSTVKLRNN